MSDLFQTKNQKFIKFIVFSIVFSLFLVLIGKLYFLQILKGDEYLAKSNNNRFFTEVIFPQRGVFLDRYNNNLVFNDKLYFLVKNPNVVYSEKVFLDRQTALIKKSQQKTIESLFYRLYPIKNAMAHVIGYTGDPTKQDLEKNRLYKVVGKMGMEKSFDDRLQGLPGEKVYEIDTMGHKLRLVSSKKAIDGENIKTTLDPFLSIKAYRLMKGLKGTILIADASNDKILTLISSPSFDPNILIDKKQNSEQRNELLSKLFSDKSKVFFNRAVSGVYPPGSIFKLVTSIAGLESGKITPDFKVEDKGYITVDEYTYKTWWYIQSGQVEGILDLKRAIARSNDIYFYKVAEKTGVKNLVLYADLMGFGKKTGIKLPNENNGLVPTPEWKERVKGESWYLGNTYHLGIGQGDLLVTPIQILQMVHLLANRGVKCTPDLEFDNNQQCIGTGIKEENIKYVLDGMIQACSSGGTARVFFDINDSMSMSDDPFLNIKNGAVACKTGTAEFGRASKSGERPTHAWFVAIKGIKIPAFDIAEEQKSELIEKLEQKTKHIDLNNLFDLDDKSLHDLWLLNVLKYDFPKQIVIVVLVESDENKKYREGSIDSAPIARDIIDWIEKPINIDNLNTDNEQTTE